MKNIKYEKESFCELIKNSNNLSDAAKKMGLNPFCGNRSTIKKYIELYGVDISHFRTMYENRKVVRRNLDEILVNGINYNSTDLKERLFLEGLKERKCELCGQDEYWHGNKLSLILDHINGIHNDNRFENLRIVCPNCDATLPTFSGRNVKNSKYVTTLKIDKITNYCGCGIEIDEHSKKCRACDSKTQRKVERPELNILQNEVKELGYSATGRKYGVSDNAIRKWLKI